MRLKTSKSDQERDNSLSLIIEKSIDIKSVIQSIDEKASSLRSKKSTINDSIHELEMKINKMVHLTDCKDQNVIEIKNHLVDLY